LTYTLVVVLWLIGWKYLWLTREGNQMTREEEIAAFWERKLYKAPAAKMKPWEEKYDRDHDPAFAPKQIKFGQ